MWLVVQMLIYMLIILEEGNALINLDRLVLRLSQIPDTETSNKTEFKQYLNL